MTVDVDVPPLGVRCYYRTLSMCTFENCVVLFFDYIRTFCSVRYQFRAGIYIRHIICVKVCLTLHIYYIEISAVVRCCTDYGVRCVRTTVIRDGPYYLRIPYVEKIV